MIQYTLYTEDTNAIELQELAGKYFEAFTMYRADGYWKGTKEPALVIVIMGAFEDGPIIAKLSKDICDMNEQESVIIATATLDMMEYGPRRKA